jgi:hypothetical protein
MPQMQNGSANLKSEDDAWTLLEWLLAHEENTALPDFDGWPMILLKIEGDRYESTLPTGLMRQVSEIQLAINRCYGRNVYKKDARSVNQAERDELELVFEVHKGSTELKADATGLLDRIGDAMKERSTARVAGITLVALALVICGSGLLSTTSTNRTTVEVKRLELLAKAVESAPNLKDASPEFQKIYKDIVASASDADRITVGSQHLSTTDISTIASSQRVAGQRVEMEGTFKVDAIRRYSKHSLIDVTLPSGEKIRARIVFDRFTEDAISSLLMAVAKNTSIHLSITAMKHKDESYSSARITAIGT